MDSTANTSPQAEQFQEWAKVELMGRQAIAGLVTTNNARILRHGNMSERHLTLSGAVTGYGETL